MRCAIVLLALVALGAAIPPQPKQRAADQELLGKQQDCINLLQQITQPIPNEQLHELGVNYDIESNYQQYENPIVVKYYVGAVKAGLVQPKGTVFSNSIGQLRKEVNLLYKILVGAQDYQTFLQTAAWARVHVNEEQFIKAFTGAILTRPDTQGVILPAPYEIIPQHFFDARIIQEAQEINQKGYETQNIQNVVIPVNYTAYLPHGEHQLSYFTQDVGLATYYNYVNLVGNILHHPQQLPGIYQQQGVGQEQEHIGHGSRYYYLHQQLLARYQLNRLGNGLGPIPEIDITNVKAPFTPHLRYTNGLDFPGRPEVLPLVPAKKQLVHHVQTLLQRVTEAIDSGHVITPQGAFLSLYQPQGLNILGDLIEGTGSSVNPRYYGNLQVAARILLGNAPQVQNIWDHTPSVLELGQTCVRDPVFYQLYKKLVGLFHHYQQSLPAYQQDDLILPGVTITGVEISKLVTFFDDHYVGLNGATIQPHGQQHHGQPQILAHLKRLDHKPYEYQINVQSERNIPGTVIRVYVGPKYDFQGNQITIDQHRHLFVELDQFIQDLQQGQNVIVRHSHQSPIQSHDYPSVEEITQRVEGAVRSQEPFYITEPQQIFGFPARLSLPKGRQTGLPLQLLVVITGPGQHHTTQYGPVIPQEEQTYQHQHYQVITTEEYQQLIQGQGQGQVQVQHGIKPTIQVLPQQHGVQQGVETVVKTHSGSHLYTKQHGQYPITGQVPQTQTEGQIYGIHGQYGQQYHTYGQQQTQQQYHGQQQTQQYRGQQLPYQQGVQGVTGGLQGVQGVVGGIHGVQGIQGIQGVQGTQGVKGVIGGLHSVQGLQGGVQGVQGGQGLQGVQQGLQGGVQGVQGIQGLQGVQGLHGVQGLQGLQGIQGFKGHQGYQGQTIWGSGQTHGGGYQGIVQGLKQQGTQVGDYFQGKHISEMIGGAISLDGKPLGFPLNRPFAPGALNVPNICVHDVHVYHEGQPTGEIFQ